MSGTSVASSMPLEPQPEVAGLTTFGFLNDTDEQNDSSFALGSLFNRVRTALGAAPIPETPTPTASSPVQASASSSVDNSLAPLDAHRSPSTGRSFSNPRKTAAARSPLGLSTLDEDTEASMRASPPSRTSTADFSRTRRAVSDRTASDRISPSRARKPEISMSNTMSSSDGGASRQQTKQVRSVAPSRAISSLKSLPLPIRTVAPAPAVTFTSPALATTHRVTATGASSSIQDDQESVIADDGEDPDASRDHLGALRNTAVDHSHWAAHGWSAIPGFPLSKDILADDARSIHSSSSRFPRSEANDEASFASLSAAQLGLQTSADAIIRRIRGEGLSRKFWMADENAKECRECLTVFTPFRRKHHCRICGQIFCGRCASHIIKGTRFGYDGMVRVCNHCMRMLDDYDRHAASHGPHVLKSSRGPTRVLPDKGMISAPLEAQVRSPQAQFAANHLFASASAGPGAFSMSLPKVDSFASALTQPDSEDESDAGSVSHSPHGSPRHPSAHKSEGASTSAAPFRKGVADDDMAPAAAADETVAAELEEEEVDRLNGSANGPVSLADAKVSPTLSNGRHPQQAPPTDKTSPTSNRRTAHRVPFPHEHGVLSHDAGQVVTQTSEYPRLRLISDAMSRHPSQRTRLRSKNAVAADLRHAREVAGKSKLTDKDKSWVSPLMKDETKSEGSSDDANLTPDLSKDSKSCMLDITPDLLESSVNHMALEHLTTMLEQMLSKHGLARVKVWLDVLLPMVLTAVSKVKPNPRESERMDVRQFIKIKRIPGGKPTECEYIDGFVCSKNVATKSMARKLPLTNARIMVVRFPLDYHRGSNQFMSLEPLMAQEREFIRILVARIVALRPQIVVVERSVSNLALELLEKAGVIVVWSMKPHAVESISRCTQADIITSIDRLALDPKLGRCHSFSVDTYEHACFPEKRKTFMRFEGTPKDLGCTIILRGADGPRLSQIKRIVELMIFVAYNLRLEEHVMRDEGAAMDTIYSPFRDSKCLQPSMVTSADHGLGITSDVDGELSSRAKAGDDDAFIQIAMRRIDRALQLYQNTVVSSSACIRLSPPYPVVRLKMDNDRLIELKRQREAEELQRILEDEGRRQRDKESLPATSTPEGQPIATENSDVVAPVAVRSPSADAPGDSQIVRSLEVLAEDAVEDQDGEKEMEEVQSQEEDDAETPKAIKMDPLSLTKFDPVTKDQTRSTTVPLAASAGQADTDDLHIALAPMTPATGITPIATPKPSFFSPGTVSELPSRITSPVSLFGTNTSCYGTMVPFPPGSGAAGGLINSDLLKLLRSPTDVAKEAEFGLAKERHIAMLRSWRRYLDVRPEDISPFHHQQICMLISKFCAVTQKPCEGPNLVSINFYGNGDETLGGHLEKMARNSTGMCSIKGCGRANVLHYHTYVHNQIRIQVVLERFVCPIPGEENRLLSWSYCKVCENATPVAIVTQESWSFSFAKYLEMYFYRHSSCKTQLCDHDFYRDQVRYFAYQNLAVRFHSEEVDMYEVSVPSTKLFISPERQSHLKNEESVTFSRKNLAYWESVLARIKMLGNEACSEAAGSNKERNRNLLSDMIKRCEADRREIESMIARTYRSTAPTNVLCLNNVRRALQEKVVKWDVDFIEFEKNFLPSEKDVRRITTTHLKRLFAEKEPTESKADGFGSTLPTATELDEPNSQAPSAGEKSDTGGPSASSPSVLGIVAAEAAAVGAVGPDVFLPDQLQPGAVTGRQSAQEEKQTSQQPSEQEAPKTETASKSTDLRKADEASSAKAVTPIELGASKFRDGNHDDDTDTTYLSPVETRSCTLVHSDGVSVTAPSSPTYTLNRNRNRFISPPFSRADESSCTESEIVGTVSSLVKRFDSPRRPIPVHASTNDSPFGRQASELRRPSLRRGKTEEAISNPSRASRSGAHGKADIASPSAAEPRAESLSNGNSRASSPTRRGSQTPGQSRVPRIKRGDSTSSITSSRKGGTIGPSTPSAPPSSYKPPKGEGLKAGPRPVIGRSGAGLGRNRGSDSDRPSGPGSRVGAGTKDGISGTFPRQSLRGNPASLGQGSISSRVPIARRAENGPGTRSRVSTIAKHFDRISREAERERERQHRMLVAQRAKRARPVAMTRAKVEVFHSIKEAVRDDESDCDSISSEDDGASAADNEDEGDDSDGDENDEGDLPRRRRSTSPSPSRNRKGAVVPGHGNREANDDTIKARTARKGIEADQDGGQSNSTIKGRPAVGYEGATDGGKDDRGSAESGVVLRKAGTAGSELESDAQSVAASSVTGSNFSSTLPSYLRNSIFADTDSTTGVERSFLKTLSGLWAFRTGEMVPLEYPMLNSEHVFGDSAIIFREDEPSSIVAFTLSSSKYNDQLRTMQNEGTRIREQEEAFMPGTESGTDSDAWGMIDVEGGELETVLKREGRHFRCEFESGSTKLWCKILFAEQFDALRRTCACEESFIESLSRCVKWDSSGGKSGSAFLKTRDDRFVVKQLSRFEMDTFSKFAPQYFNYMSQCFSQERRSTLAKIFGCFRIGFRNPQTGKSLKMDCLVMENLFYGREITKIYDLKGSMRNRHIQETGRANEVLLDENLVELAHQSPLFVREHSKRLLRSALYNDSLFLADMNVMDYSLIVGLDKQKQELVVGIIDFVRTFTWDKRVESFVKETALLGGAGKGEPTIITPKQYRIRFLSFLDKSFLLAPDCWVGGDWTQ